MSKKGFTLIELLVVIAIIGLLATIVTAALSTAKAKGRDGRRIADIKTIQTALELYFNDNGFYPANIYSASCSSSPTPSCGLAPLYISAVPTDPGYNVAPTSCTGAPYSTAGCYGYKAYAPSGACNASNPPYRYHLGVMLEQTTNSALLNDADAPTTGGVFGTLVACTTAGSAAFDGTSAPSGSTSLCNGTSGSAQPGGTEACYDQTP